MITGETTSGYHFEIDETRFDDFEVLDAIADMDSGVPTRLISGLSTFLVKVLGVDGRKALYDHVRTQDGRVPTENVRTEVREILTAGGEQAKKF